MYKLLWTGALLASIIAVVSVPASGDGRHAATVTVAEARLIDNIREMATAPALSKVSILEVEVALTPPRPTLDPEPALAPASGTRNLVVAAEALNLRASPSKSGEVLARLLQGESVQVAARNGVWVQVATADGVTGWANSDYLAEAAVQQ